MVCLFVFLCLVCNLFVIIHCSVPPPGPWAAAVRLSTMMMGRCEHSYLSLINTEESLIIHAELKIITIPSDCQGSGVDPILLLLQVSAENHCRGWRKLHMSGERIKLDLQSIGTSHASLIYL